MIKRGLKYRSMLRFNYTWIFFFLSEESSALIDEEIINPTILYIWCAGGKRINPAQGETETPWVNAAHLIHKQ